MANETVTVTQSVNNVHVVTSGATGLNAGGDIDGNLSITPIWNESGTEFTSLLLTPQVPQPVSYLICRSVVCLSSLLIRRVTL